ncbi:MAG: zinc metalloprotease HtpX [Thermodesulfobacteriota bacterium]|nr:zinc metalloprotease HtpX [Thermodesulfobacteriota bacterium]
MNNQIRTTILLGALTGVIVLAGGMIGGKGGMIIALVLAAGMNFFSYWYSDKIVLKMYRARPILREEAQGLYQMVETLAQRAGLPMPTVFVIPQEAPNAFATGRNPENAVVAVTQGLLRHMNDQELAGVIAHELGHVKNRDILIGSIAATLAGAIMVLASFARWAAIFGGVGRNDDDGGGIIGLIAMSILAPIAAMMIQMAISRSREYLADSTSATITGNPEGLASALAKLGAYSKQIPFQAEPATAHMFITNPLAGKSLMNLFSTHPPIEQRIARLRG